MSNNTFVVKKHIPLAHLGEGWEEAYVDMSPFTFNDNDTLLRLRKLASDQQNMNEEDAKKTSDEIIGILKAKLIGGKGFDGTKLIDISKENFADLPMELIVHVLQVIQGQSLLPPKG